MRVLARRFASIRCLLINRLVVLGLVVVRRDLLSSGPAPLSRELDALFRSEVGKPPIRNRRLEHLAGLGSAMWRFQADAHARFLERMRAPGRPGEPQSTGGEQRRYCQGQMFCFHYILLFDSSFTFTLLRHCARISGSWLSIWNEGGEFWCEGPASGNEADPFPCLPSVPWLWLTGIPVFAGFREWDAWWDSFFRSSGRRRSRH